jgi:hypothetical protein
MAASFRQGSVIDFDDYLAEGIPSQSGAIVDVCVGVHDVYPYLSRILCLIIAMEQIDVSFDNCFGVLAFSRESHQVYSGGQKSGRP